MIVNCKLIKTVEFIIVFNENALHSTRKYRATRKAFVALLQYFSIKCMIKVGYAVLFSCITTCIASTCQTKFCQFGQILR